MLLASCSVHNFASDSVIENVYKIFVFGAPIYCVWCLAGISIGEYSILKINFKLNFNGLV